MLSKFDSVTRRGFTIPVFKFPDDSKPLTSVMTIDSTLPSPSPLEGQSMYDLPSDFRNTWLLEHSLWEIGGNEWDFDNIRNSTRVFNANDMIMSCEIKRNSLLLGRSLLSLDYRPYLESHLSSKNFIGYFKNNVIYYKSGIPITQIHIITPYQYCNGSLQMSFFYISYWKKGFLRPETGAIVDHHDDKYCLDLKAPTQFFIPFQKNGSYNLVSALWIKPQMTPIRTVTLMLNHATRLNP